MSKRRGRQALRRAGREPEPAFEIEECWDPMRFESRGGRLVLCPNGYPLETPYNERRRYRGSDLWGGDDTWAGVAQCLELNDLGEELRDEIRQIVFRYAYNHCRQPEVTLIWDERFGIYKRIVSPPAWMKISPAVNQTFSRVLKLTTGLENLLTAIPGTSEAALQRAAIRQVLAQELPRRDHGPSLLLLEEALAAIRGLAQAASTPERPRRKDRGDKIREELREIDRLSKAKAALSKAKEEAAERIVAFELAERIAAFELVADEASKPKRYRNCGVSEDGIVNGTYLRYFVSDLAKLFERVTNCPALGPYDSGEQEKDLSLFTRLVETLVVPMPRLPRSLAARTVAGRTFALKRAITAAIRVKEALPPGDKDAEAMFPTLPRRKRGRGAKVF